MKKIPTLLIRNPENPGEVLHEVTPGCEWVLAGHGIATRKYDGVCTLLDADGVWFARREVKPDRPTPEGFVLTETDPATGKSVGWVPIAMSGHAKWHADALTVREKRGLGPLEAGTYELVGPRVNGNPERYDHHTLIAHANAQVIGLADWETTDVTDDDYGGLRSTLLGLDEFGYEGIVWHHPDGRMAKLKARDFR
ncbi:MAG: hypothetical protein ABW167_07600 [Baekduia sp.]